MPYKDKQKALAWRHKHRDQKRLYDQKRNFNPSVQFTQKSLKKARLLKIGKWLQDLKVNLSCSRCGEDDWRCLDFHHTTPLLKDFTISSAVSRGLSCSTIEKEISKCLVLCSNCHRKEHFSMRLPSPQPF